MRKTLFLAPLLAVPAIAYGAAPHGHKAGSPAKAAAAGKASNNQAKGLPPPPSSVLLKGKNGSPSVRMSQNNKAFRKALPQAGLGMTPKQIEQYRLLELRSALASHKVITPHKVNAPLVRISLAPGQVSKPIHLAVGYATAIEFQDSTGRPWPVEKDVPGNQAAFNTVIPPSKTHNVLVVTSYKIGASSDVVVTLKGLSSPIVLMLDTTQTQVDPRVVAQIDKKGPNARKPVFVSGPSLKTASRPLLDALNGITPPGAQRLLGNGSGLEVWRKGGTMYVRSHATLRLPPVVQAQVSSGSYTAWKLPFTPRITLAKHGAYHTVEIPSG